MEALRYEMFVRFAFQYATNTEVGRWGDPAKLANTDYFSDRNLAKVKAAISYSMEIYNSEIAEMDVTDADYNLMNEILEDVINAPNTSVISDLIEKYNEDIKQKYLSARS